MEKPSLYKIWGRQGASFWMRCLSLVQEQFDWLNKLQTSHGPILSSKQSSWTVGGKDTVKLRIENILQFLLEGKKEKDSKHQYVLKKQKDNSDMSLNCFFSLIAVNLFWNSCRDQVLLADSWFEINRKESVFSWHWFNMLMMYEKVKLFPFHYY